MSIKDVRVKAKGLGIEPGNMPKKDLIHAIQRVEGHTECYGHFGDDCPYLNCCFRSDCKKVK